MKKKQLVIFLLIIIVLSGFGREYIMVNINLVIKHLSLGAPNYSQSFFYPLLDWQLVDLDKLKWLLTILFTFYFFGLTYFLIKAIFPANKKYHKITVLFYLIIVLLSGFVFVAGYISGYTNEVYRTVRTLMGIVQSFIPLMILYLLFKFIPKLK